MIQPPNLGIARWSFADCGPKTARILSLCAALTGVPFWWIGYRLGAWTGGAGVWAAYTALAINALIWAAVFYLFAAVVSHRGARNRDLREKGAA